MKSAIAIFLLILFGFSALAGEPTDRKEQQKQSLGGVWKDIPQKEAEKYLQWRAKLSAGEKEWELTLEKHLGNFYFSQHLKAQNLKNAGERWSDWGFGYVKDDPALPRILLIGDSISRSYTSGVRRALSGEANVHRAPANCGSSVNGVEFMDEWLGKKKWDCIVFNFGIHDRAQKTEIYQKNLEMIITRLKRTGAKLFWARTTPILLSTGKPDPRINAVNAVADGIMKRNPDITVLDLNSVIFMAVGGMRAQIGKDNTHMTYSGNQLLITAVSHGIRERFLQKSDSNTEWYNARTPGMEDFRLSPPSNHRKFRKEDFRIDRERVRNAPLKETFATRSEMLQIAEKLEHDPAGKRVWDSMVSRGTIRHLNPWNLVNPAAPDYTNRFYNSMGTLPVVYFLTGQKETGKLIHDYTMHSLSLGDSFWYGDKILYPGFPKKRVGTLCNSQLGITYALILSFASDVFSPEEIKQLEARLLRDGLDACSAFLEINKKASVSNFTAVLAGGLYVFAKYFNDSKQKEFALDSIRRFLCQGIESDGSYGEGFGYFKYPMNVLYSVLSSMSQDECRRLLEKTPLRHTPEWYAYRYFFTVRNEKNIPLRTVFCDDNFIGTPTASSCLFFAICLDRPLGGWIGKKFSSFPASWWISGWQDLKYSVPNARSPKELNLPLVRTFENGESFIRSSWDDNATVFALYGARPTKTAQNHQRPERNSFNLGAFGEPIVMSAGYTNRFHGPLHGYTSSTRSSNALQIDDSDQRWWWSVPKPTVPETDLLLCCEGKIADVLMNEGAKAYKEEMKSAKRTVVHLKKAGVFILHDIVKSAGKTHLYTTRIHLNNLERRSTLTKRNENHWIYRQPNVEMKIFMDSDQSFQAVQKNDDLIINPKYPILDLARQERERGNVLTLEMRNSEKKESLQFFTVLQPYKPGKSNDLFVVRNGNILVIGDFRVEISENKVIVSEKGEIEIFSPETSLR